MIVRWWCIKFFEFSYKKWKNNDDSDDEVIVILKESSKQRNIIDLKRFLIEECLLELVKQRQKWENY